MARQDHPSSKMRAADLRTRGYRHRARQRSGHTATIQLVSNFFGTIFAGFIQPFKMFHQSG
jgi:hypothetical protein